MEIDEIIKSLWKRRLLMRVWVVFAVVTVIAAGLFMWPGKDVISKIHVKEGNVTVYEKSSKSWITAVVGQSLKPGSKIRTGAESTAEIRLEDGVLQRLIENAELHILAFYKNPWQGISIVDTKIIHGYVLTDAGESGSIYNIRLENSNVSVTKGVCLISNNEVKPLTENCEVVLESSSGIKIIRFGKKVTIDKKGNAVLRDTQLNDGDKALLLSIKPILVLDKDYIETVQSTVKITGETNPGNFISVDGLESIQAEIDGSFEFVIENQSIGKAERIVTSRDVADRETTKKIIIHRKKTKEMTEHLLEILTPVQDSRIDDAYVTVSGIVQGSEKIKVETPSFSNTVLPDKDTFTFEVPLNQGKQTILVTSTSSDGNSIQKFRNVERVKGLKLATISITSSPKKFNTNKESIKIKGNTNTDFVFFKNEEIAVRNGSFELIVELDLGENIIVIIAGDSEHKQKSAEIMVYRAESSSQDLSVPTIQLDSYKKIVNRTIFAIKGTVKNADKLTLGNEIVKISSDGSFKYSTHITEGINHFELIATGANGKTSKQVVDVVCDITAPDLSKLKAIRDPESGNVTISGLIEALAEFYVKGVDMIKAVSNVEGGKYSSILQPIEDHEGKFIRVKAIDLAGNIKERDIPIESDTETP